MHTREMLIMDNTDEHVKKHILEATNLTKIYGKRQVVKNINLSVKTGEIVGLLGPNGAGKTTTFYMIVGLIRPDGGDITLNGDDLSSMPMYIRARKGIGYLPQEPSIFRKLTVRQNLEAVLEIAEFEGVPRTREDIKSEVERLLKEFNLLEFADRDGFRLSGGERRRTEIARAIAVRPTFMLFDEPFAGIDPLAIIELKKMLLYLRSKGLGILITDHNVRETLSITDRAYIISNGAVLAEGAADDLVNNPEVKEAYLGEEFRL
jgi:lipopolysaccharide export system ATP-binding protein